jgi:hypothetical protein
VGLKLVPRWHKRSKSAFPLHKSSVTFATIPSMLMDIQLHGKQLFFFLPLNPSTIEKGAKVSSQQLKVLPFLVLILNTCISDFSRKKLNGAFQH